MIYDKTSNLHKYKGLNKNLDDALNWLEKHTYKDVDLGITHITDHVFVKKMESTTLDNQNLMCEIHYETADIHIFAGHDDDIIYESNNKIDPKRVLHEYDKKNDVMFFKAQTKEALTPVTKDTFAIFLPNEVHCPRRNSNHTTIIKAIVKIRW